MDLDFLIMLNDLEFQTAGRRLQYEITSISFLENSWSSFSELIVLNSTSKIFFFDGFFDEFMKGFNPMEVHQNNFLLQANKMLDGLEGKDCDLTTLEEAKLNLRITMAAKKSWMEKKIVMLDKEDLQ